MDILVIILFVLAVSRLTRLVNKDYITDPLRLYVMRRFGGPNSVPAYFLSCPWCVSMWVALMVAPLVILATSLSFWLFPVLALAASQITGWLDKFDPEDIEIEVE